MVSLASGAYDTSTYVSQGRPIHYAQLWEDGRVSEMKEFVTFATC